MRLTFRLPAFAAAAVLALTMPLNAQARQGVMGDLTRDVGQVEKKVLGLAQAIPESAYAWRPGKGVRSTGETFLHIAADNYLLPVLLGAAAPAETGITRDFATATAFEKRPMSKAAVIAELEKSFAFLRTAMTATPDTKMDEAIEMFGRPNTYRGVWIMTTTHLHEHLGQLIAYARSNNVTPPWSK